MFSVRGSPGRRRRPAQPGLSHFQSNITGPSQSTNQASLTPGDDDEAATRGARDKAKKNKKKTTKSHKRKNFQCVRIEKSDLEFDLGTNRSVYWLTPDVSGGIPPTSSIHPSLTRPKISEKAGRAGGGVELQSKCGPRGPVPVSFYPL